MIKCLTFSIKFFHIRNNLSIFANCWRFSLQQDILVKKKRFAISLLLKPEKFQDNERVTKRFPALQAWAAYFHISLSGFLRTSAIGVANSVHVFYLTT